MLHDMNSNLPPVRVGEILRVTPLGIKEDDPFCKHHGFVIFIKRAPKKDLKTIMIRVTAVKERYGFADFIEES